MQTQKCDCGTKQAAIVWCYIHGYVDEYLEWLKGEKVLRKTQATTKPTELHQVPFAAAEAAAFNGEVKPRARRRTRKVCRCGNTFYAKRADRKFCSDACRQRDYRDSANLPELVENGLTVTVSEKPSL